MRKMSGKSPILVHLLLEDHSLAERWHAALAGCAAVCCHDPLASVSDAPDKPTGLPHVLVIEGDPAIALRTERALARGETALLRIRRADQQEKPIQKTIEAAVHAELPADATSREIQLICRLLAEIVVLRRRARRHARRQRSLAALADTDPLTGLMNRRGWQRALGALRVSPVAPHCMIMFDIDHFKRINDVAGYAAGDAALSDVGAALRHAVRSGDAVARLGGDEFGVLLAHVEPQAAGMIVERLRTSMASSSAAQQAISASAGYACFLSGKDCDEPAIMAAVDAALREAKLAGRDRAIAATVPG
jgi:diguanylate cyclase (GGDEF)-like protein